jgi:hypothetical protein
VGGILASSYGQTDPITVETHRTDYVTGDTVRVFGTIKFDIIIDIGVESPKP